MSLRRVCFLAVFLLAAALTPSVSWGAAVRVMNADPPCGSGKTGFSGVSSTATGNALIHFGTCAVGVVQCHSKIWKDRGAQPLTEVRIEGGVMTVWVAGIDVSNPATITEEQVAQIRAVMQDGQEFDVGQELFEDVLSLGMNPSSDPMQCLQYHAQLFGERTGINAPLDCPDCNNPNKGCVGCCGRRCTAPGGTRCGSECTEACKQHDEECGMSVLNVTQRCMQLTVLALNSAHDCLWAHIGDGCGSFSGVACDCCGP